MSIAQHKARAAWPALPITILLIAFALPPETSVSIGSLRLSPYRLTIMFFLVPAIGLLFQNRKTPLCLPDGLLFLHSAWAAAALIFSMGFSEGIETAGIYFIETFGAYAMARAYVQTVADFTNVIRLIFTIAATLLVFAALEAFSGAHLLRDPFQAVFGGSGPHAVEPRLGMTRAFASFEHPILYGVFVASAFAGTYYVLCDAQLNAGSLKKLGAVVLATFFSLSGGPFTALGFQMGLIAWDRMTRGISGRWNILTGFFIGTWLVISLLSNRSPILIFISYLTFSADSAYNRIHVWNYGTAEVARHPFIGLGLGEWIRAPWMSSSMDNFWLLTTMRYGVPALVFLLLTIVVLSNKLKKAGRQSPLCRNPAKAWLVTILSFTIAGLTVHFWNALMVQFFFLIGCGLAATYSARTSAHPFHQPRPSPRSSLTWS